MKSSLESTAFQSAAELIVAGDFSMAVRNLTAALVENPDDGRLWELRGQAHLGEHDPIDAVNCLEHAQCLVPLRPEGELALAHAYELCGKRQSASDLLTLLSAKKNLPACILEPLARALGRLSNPQLALSVCRQAASRMPDSPAPLMGMVFYQRRLGFAPERMLPLLFRAFHLEPDDFTIRMTLARMLYECGRATEAAQLLSVVSIESSNCPSCLSAMQAIFEEAGDQERAAECLEALVSLAATNE